MINPTPRFSRLSRALQDLLPVVLAVPLLSVAGGAHAQGSVTADKAALIALYNATDGASWTTSTNWNSDEPLSSWHGVTTDAADRVTELALDGNGLQGSLPAALGDLSALERLDLRDNDLSGALPSALARLTNLTVLLLDRSRALTGALPGGLRGLANLTTVQIAHTELCAPADDAFQGWLDTISFSGLTCPPSARSTIDLAVFYTPAARDWRGGTQAIRDRIDELVAATNQAYQRSRVNQRVTLVAVEEMAYVESHSHTTDLSRLVGRNDGYMDEVHSVRDRVAADLVVLVRLGDSTSSAQGVIRPLSTSTPPVFATSYLPGGSLIFAHELGHLMGLHHDRYQACGGFSCFAAAFPYAYGYVNQKGLRPLSQVSSYDRWRTIMSYSDQCTAEGYYCWRAPRFSNPDQNYQRFRGFGSPFPLGVAGLAPSNSRTAGPADAVRALNRTRAYVANLRQAPNITVSFDAGSYTATEGGTAATVTVRLSAAPTRPIDIPLTAAPGSATAYDYAGVPASLSFAANETERTFTVTAVDDLADENDESLTLALGTPPARGVTLGSRARSTVTLVDDDTETGAPSILTVELTSHPGADALYAIGDDLEVSVRFNKVVTVTGEPQLALGVGSGTRQAAYRNAAGEVARFAYLVAEGDLDADGVSIAANSLVLNGGTIRDGANQNALLVHSRVSGADHAVEAIRPVLQSATANTTELTLTYDESLDATAVPPTSAYTVRVGGAARRVTGAAVRGSEVIVTVDRAIPFGDDVATVSYRPGSPPVRDVPGNAAMAFSNQSVDGEMPPYDSDGDGLIEITNLTQLDVVRHDLDGDGAATATSVSAYQAAFPGARTPLRCVGACAGYELLSDLDFDAEGKWNSGLGWQPIGWSVAPFNTTFEGNGHTIANLYINRRTTGSITGTPALFGTTSSAAAIRNVGLVNVDVTSSTLAGGSGLVGTNRGTITASYATGEVRGGTAAGLVVSNPGTISGSYASVRAIGLSNGTGRYAGGLAGHNAGTITTSYATGRVTGQGQTDSVGGLVGRNASIISGSYATGPVSDGAAIGGLVGSSDAGTVTASYWDTDTSGQTDSAGGVGKTTTELQAPTGSSGIYATWSGWDFGTGSQYPALTANGDGEGAATWQEFGHQLRERPTLRATADGRPVRLEWSAVETTPWELPPWSPAPEVTYTVTRDNGTAVTVIGDALSELTDTDAAVPIGATWTYQVAAVVDGGEAVRSATVQVTGVAPNRSPVPVGTLAAMTLPVESSPVSVSVDVSGAFSDPDDDVLTYGAVSSAPSVVSVSVSGSTVEVTPLTAGVATVSVTATDVDGSNGTATQRFVVTANRPPVAVGSLDAVTTRVGDARVYLDVADAFTDPDNDPLVYLANSANGDVASVGTQSRSSRVFVDAHTVGSTTGTVTATDVTGSNRAAEQQFTVRVLARRGVGVAPVSLTVDEGSSASYDVVLEAEPVGSVTVTPSAPSGTDVSVSPSSLTFTDADWDLPQGVTVEAAEDTDGASDAPVTIRNAVSGGDYGSVRADSVVVTILENDVSALSTVDGTAPESDGEVAFQVSISVAGTADVTVDYATSDGTARAGSDYTSTSGTLTFPQGSTSSQSIRVPVLDDGADEEEEETFTLTLRNVRNGVLAGGGATLRVTGTIEDDDEPAVTVSFGRSRYEVAEGRSVVVEVRLDKDAERAVAVPLEAAHLGGASAADYAGLPLEVTFGPAQRSAEFLFSATVDGEQEAGESVELQFGSLLPFGVTAGPATVVAIRDDGGGRGPGGGDPGGGRPPRPPNRPPETVGTLADQALTLGADPAVVDVAAAFRDPDRDELTYAAESSADDVAAVSADGSVVTVTPVGAGTAVVTVTAADEEKENAPATQTFAVTVVIDYDADADGLIEVRTPAQLDAVRHDLDGNGVPTAAGEASHAAAFEGAIGGLSCGAAGCRGYELMADLDFDTNGSGGPDAGDAYWNNGSGWEPVGTEDEPFAAVFEGNGRVIRRLFVAGGEGAGLFGATGASSAVARVGLIAAEVTGTQAVGVLAGVSGGRVTAAWATGRVSGTEAVGGLVGSNAGDIGGSFAAVAVSGERQAGGLVGVNEGSLVAVHATGRVSGSEAVGGLVGQHRGTLTASYATGRVRGTDEAGGLVGAVSEPGTVMASYWDTETSGLASSAAGRGLTTSALQRPTAYGGPYAGWNVDVDGDGVLDGPWHLGTAAQYPVLTLDVDGDGRASWPELGRQLRAGPVLTATAASVPAEIVLTWTAADSSAWTPLAAVTYTVTRETGAAVETAAAGLRGARYVDTAVQPGSTYTYQVAAVVDGGEAARSARVTAAVPCAYAVTPPHRDVLWAAGTGQVAVATAPGCTWTAASESGFLAVTAGTGGSGPGTVRYTVAANAGGPRRGALVVAGQRVTVYQASPTAFTDHPVERGVTPVKAIHFLELRARIDALRGAVGRAAFRWTDPVLTPGATPIRRVHLTELRAALAEAYSAAGRGAPVYTDPVITDGATAIKATHLMELRVAVTALE